MEYGIYPLLIGAVVMAGPVLAQPAAPVTIQKEDVRKAGGSISYVGVCDSRSAPITAQEEDVRASPITLDEKGARAAPVAVQEPETTTAPTTVERKVSPNRILLVDLGERELKKRQELRARDLRNSEKLAPECQEPVERRP